MVQLKLALSEAGKTVGSEKQWPELRAQLKACLPCDERMDRLSLAFGEATKLADQAASQGDGETYRRAARQLWTAATFVDF